MLSLVLLLHASTASKLVEYKFYKNYGQIFFDFSGNSRHAISGASLAEDSSDILGTDRGAYFDGSSDRITLPPNEKNTKSLDLPTDFTILFWRKWISETGDKLRSIFERKFNPFQIYLERSSKSSNITLKVITNCHNVSYSNLGDTVTSNY